MGEREELIAAIRARVDRVNISGSPSAVLTESARADALRLAGYGPEDPADLDGTRALGWLFYHRSRGLPLAAAARELEVAITCFMPCFLMGEGDLPRPLLAVLAQRVLPQALGLLTSRSEAATDAAGLTFAVGLWQRIADGLPDQDPDAAMGLIGLSLALNARFKLTRQVTDARRAVEAGRAAVRAAPSGHPHHVMGLLTVAEALLALSGHTEDPGQLDEAVDAGRVALRSLSDDDPTRASVLNNLALALKDRFQRGGPTADMEEAIDVGRAAVRAYRHDDPERAAGLSNLGLALQQRAERTGSPEDLDEAVELGRAALRAAPGSAPVLTGLSHALKRRSERTGSRGDLGEAVELARASVRATDADDALRPVRLAGLGNALRLRFEYTGHLADLDEAVETGRTAVRSTARDFPEQANNLSGLSTTLRIRFRHTGELADADEAVETGRAAIAAIARDHPDRAGLLSGLSLVLRMRFERTGAIRDLDEAVEHGRAAVAVTPYDHPDRVRHLSALGNALLIRVNRLGEAADADETVDVARTVVGAMPSDHADHASRLDALGLALRLRYERTGDHRDLDEAVETGRAATRTILDGHPDQVACLSNLGGSLEARFRSTGSPADRAEALAVWERAVDLKSAPPSLRIRAAQAAGQLSAASDPHRAARFLERAVQMLPEVAPRRSRRGDRQHALGRHAAGLAAEATALALADPEGTARERAVRALGLAEAARAVLLSQALDTRSDLTDLYDRHPQLAGHFAELRDLLDRDTAAEAGGAPDDGAADDGAAGRHRLTAEFEELTQHIRTCEGFADFGLPPALDALLAEAAEGPVVTYNISNHRSDALLFTRHGVISCPLPGLTEDTVAARINTFYRALAEATAPDGRRIAAQRTVTGILEWLWESVVEPVLEALAALGEAVPPSQDGQPLPRVWWAPGGLLGLLPLHAAGFHTEPERGAHRRTTLDRVVSSYTPTIRALRHARRDQRQRQRQPAEGSRSLIVAMPTTPGYAPLPHVPEEVRRIRDLLQNPVQLTEPEPDSDFDSAPDSPPPVAGVATPTKEAVLALLPDCATVHFACHGVGDRVDPSRNRLLLHDHATAALTVSALAHVDLDRAQLAYLSACGTANPGGSGLRDEAIHLTSAFQLAGFPHVIGTLWPIDDSLAIDVAESFYTRLSGDQRGTLTPANAAISLHDTVRNLRDRYPATPSLWAAYLHAGA
ncbi:CHAT domain-containing protein [Streptomyces sp. NBC_00536]|uniref:CHAT domain-containing protein n=1 Tax=Streptomyces sp. NBC_00536 TaxID=2975769 RepID=UPI002E80E83F|nr:CHAT domain-containing protein [Streptomyces sp. NBC_00536]WUC83264.1 CHAT domain-containing protein [Streptomyces sp. NBC_00536]